MDCSFCLVLEESSIGTWIRSSSGVFFTIEVIHVIGLAMVFGTIAIVDLRLLGLASNNRRFTTLSEELIKWTWGAFAVTALTGLLLFVSTATIYFVNTAFRLKLLALALAGLNMFIFHLLTAKSVQSWDIGEPVPPAGKIAGGVSLALWVCIIFFGRWIGYTKQLKLDIETIDFESPFF